MRLFKEFDGSLEEYVDTHLSEIVRLTPLKIANVAAKLLGFPRERIRGTSRKERVVLARYIGMAFSKVLFPKMSHDMIGYYIGNKDHATVTHAIKQIINSLNAKGDWRTEYIKETAAIIELKCDLGYGIIKSLQEGRMQKSTVQ